MFEKLFNEYSWEDIENKIYSARTSDVLASLEKRRITENNIDHLLSPAADDLLEKMAQIYRRLHKNFLSLTVEVCR